MTVKAFFVWLRDNIRLVSLLTLLGLWLLFLLQNMEQVQVSFLFWSFSTPRILLLLSTMCVGIVIGLIIRLKRKADKHELPPPPQL